MNGLIFLYGIFFLATPKFNQAPDVFVKIGSKDSLYSKILDEKRELVISLPAGYDTSGKNYPVLYLLDGTENNLIDARLVTYNLRTEMIIVAITNTDRNRDMMPLSAASYQVRNPGAKNFLAFLEKELLPYVENKYRSNGERTIRGRSLSGLFVMYAFLENPFLFDNYIGNCAGWFADMNFYFDDLIIKSFENKNQFHGQKIFIANSLTDPEDPNQEIHHSIVDFSKRVHSELGERISFKYATYDNAGHVPYAGFYDGLKYIMKKEEQ